LGRIHPDDQSKLPTGLVDEHSVKEILDFADGFL
jgi:hypothetical protein